MLKQGLDFYKQIEEVSEFAVDLPYDTELCKPCHTFESIKIEFYDIDRKCYNVEL